MTLHIPILRKGTPYRSLDVAHVPHHRTGETFAEVSQANAGLIRRDLLGPEAMKSALTAFSSQALLDMCRQAAKHFAEDTLPLGDTGQSPEDYIRQVSATTGLPHALARRNLQRIRGVLEEMDQVVRGLTRGLDLRILDEGFGEAGGHVLSYFPRGRALGVVLPSNSPGVHSLWVPAIALKTPLVLKPGSAEPWTPLRLVQALTRAGCPREAFGYYPADHAGAGEILRGCGRGILFGDVASTAAWQEDPRIEIHGPGYSKILIGEDCIDEWPKYLDIISASIAENSGRSCINASGVWVPRHAPEIARALAERLAAIVPRDAEDEQAQLAPFASPAVATRISALIDQGLAGGGAEDVSAAFRGSRRLAVHNDCTYLLPTIVRCDSADQPLANREFLFPFASVVPVRQEELPQAMGSSLVVTAITRDGALIRRLLESPLVDRLNLGAIPTNRISWDQPHEGNLFDHLYARRAFQQAVAQDRRSA